MTLLVAAALSVAIGLMLGLLGGGGSMLALPMLVYVLGVEAKQAIATSLLLVGMTSAVGVLMHARAGRVRFRTGVLFGLAGMAGAYAGGRAAHFVPARVLLIGFAGMMVATAVAMLRGARRGAAVKDRRRELALYRLLLLGTSVGALTGLVGAGGGFLVVPALAMGAGLSMHAAVGTSLLVITMQSLAGFAGYLGHVRIDLGLAALIVSASACGVVIGGQLGGRVPQEHLRKGFGGLILAVAAFLLVKQLPQGILPQRIRPIMDMEHFTPLSSLVGGVLIGLAASMLLLFNGRVAGISGIVGNLLSPAPGDVLWRVMFLLGLLGTGSLLALLREEAFRIDLPRSTMAVALAGLLVGYGTRLGNGCTSGHGVCGLARLSTRSLFATLTFIITGAATVLVVKRLFGGAL